MPDRAPADYERRILLLVTGMTPQVVTETLYALCHQHPPFIPTEVHLATTLEGAERARLSLLSDDPGWFRRLCQDYRLPPIQFDASHIHILQDQSGTPLSDIRTPEDNERAADQLTRLVRDLTTDEAAALHVSLAGGRKTMGYYLGYALSLFGRPQDRLSHVLVSEPFESSWSFFYPTPYERIIETKDGKLADCATAQVMLAEIPFVRLRDGLPPALLKGQVTMSAAVAAANRSLQPPRLVLDLLKEEVWADDLNIDVKPTELALLLWLAERVQQGKPEVEWRNVEAANEFLTYGQRILNPYGGDYERMKQALESCKDDNERAKYFGPHKSRLKKAFEEALGKKAANRYVIARSGKRNDATYSCYYLPLEADQIEIRTS
ncbi:TIGR02584 family CRISPR-associated protein [Chloracidobacterium validum]|uniref:TIGR02584 family CRISPR-associated protein n=1 Tax=Chloracidobacterium validum TaxID=2821543 RepID=A0ABX8BB26_9BACT|nr:CRISPR-associated ring nuclease Csm6 [Chloracidobacterium validum]QUW03231.1 TIGR02584 family CRISPR-associated protein [Chloracidobacterium validum]